MGQVAKIRKDATSGYVIASTGNGNINGAEVSYIVIFKSLKRKYSIVC